MIIWISYIISYINLFEWRLALHQMQLVRTCWARSWRTGGVRPRGRRCRWMQNTIIGVITPCVKMFQYIFNTVYVFVFNGFLLLRMDTSNSMITSQWFFSIIQVYPESSHEGLPSAQAEAWTEDKVNIMQLTISRLGHFNQLSNFQRL